MRKRATTTAFLIATDHRLWLLFLPLGSAPSAVNAAVRILEEKDADYLTNVEVTEGAWSILALSIGWVEADAWRRRSGSAPHWHRTGSGSP